MASATTNRLRASGGPGEELLLLLNDHRVMTTDQLARATGTPDRTVLYRLDRLRADGLVGYDRPGRHAGSAPHHWWLRPAGARLITGTAPADGRRPSAMFSAHAATITEAWLALREQSPAVGLTMTGWATDRAGWQPWEGRTSAWGSATTKQLTPDAVYEALLADGRPTAAFIEVDLASMTQTQLKAKLDRYRAYARDEAWRGRFPHCPPLLLLTTTAHRAVTFTRNAARHLGESSSAPRYGRRLVDDFDLIDAHGRLVVAATGLVRDPSRAVTEHVWTLTDPEAAEVTLTALLTERAAAATAAAPAYQRQKAEAHRQQLHDTLRRIRIRPRQLEWLLSPPAVDLVRYLLDSNHDPGDAFTPRLDTTAILTDLADWWRRKPRSDDATAALDATLTRLHHRAWSHQVRHLAHLTHQDGDRPAWYRAAAHLAQPRLLTPGEHHRLAQARTRDEAQAHIWRYWQPPEHRDTGPPPSYPAWRDEQITVQWNHLSWWQRQRTDPADLAAAFDDEHLTVCARCALTLPATDTADCPGCQHTHRLPHDQRHTITSLADLITPLLDRTADDP
ncbi:replication-relaxation family protein [Micromonospora sp. WMMD718]|uniref:replication-relaxation family protein n=1 Tax=Micromonospora sp. WMMD718 TaxID=3016098 RepID=UPI00241629AE|nr:replication-relaxation family protein [Micromonospora sp. WMMD718]MDG4749918.1 replication-relaxation family protein [Micromonospora sp. WMMD718]